MFLTINHKKHVLKHKLIKIRNYKNRLIRLNINNYELVIYLTKRHKLKDIIQTFMKPIIINNDTWYYRKKLKNDDLNEIETLFFKSPVMNIKKCFIFGVKIEVENIFPDFKLPLDIEDLNYSKDNIKKMINLEISKLI